MISAFLVFNFKKKKVLLEKKNIQFSHFDDGESKWSEKIIKEIMKKPLVLQFEKKYKVVPLKSELLSVYVYYGSIMYIVVGKKKKMDEIQILQYLSSTIQQIKKICNGIPKDEFLIIKNFPKLVTLSDEIIFGMGHDVENIESLLSKK